jgi:hypothetical protein
MSTNFVRDWTASSGLNDSYYSVPYLRYLPRSGGYGVIYLGYCEPEVTLMTVAVTKGRTASGRCKKPMDVPDDIGPS